MVYSGDLCFFNIFFSYSYLSACTDYIVNIWNNIIRIIIRLCLMGKVLVSALATVHYQTHLPNISLQNVHLQAEQ